MFIKNRKYAILRVILVGILIAGIFGVQPAQAGFFGFGWAEGGGGTNFDYGTAIAVDGNGNAYSTGFVTNGPGNQDVFINKWDTDGNFLWSKSIAGSSNESSHAVTLDGDGNVYVAGYYSDIVEFDPGNKSANRTSAGISDAFVIKYDSNGQFIWVRSVGGSSADSGTGVALDSTGNVYLIGYYNGTVDFDPGPGKSNLTSAGAMDVFVSKFDNNGNFSWAKSMGGTSEDETYDIAIDGSGNIFVTGYFSGTADFDPGLGTSNLTSVGGNDLFISKLDSNGNFVWAKSMGSPSADNGIEIALDGSGNIYLAGYFMDAIDTGVGILVSAGFYDILISKLDKGGNVLWAKGLGGTEYDVAYGIVLDGEGNVCITGEFSGTVDFDPGAGTSHLTSAGASDIFISKLGSNGNFIWAKHLGGTSQDVGDGIAVDASNNVYLTGYYSDTANFDPGPGAGNIFMTSTGSADIFISKLILWPQGYYVNHNARGANNGSSPADAYTDLQSALAVASSGDQIWVAAGTYKPTTSTDRTISFRLKKGVAIYGGFEETFRNRTSITVLSGDIGVSGNNSDNSYHVVVGSNTNSSTILDGFIITGGNANLTPLDMGGGMLNQNGSPTLTNVAFSRNTAVRSGGGMVNDDHSSPTLTNVTFDSNIASAGGGMMNWSNSSPTLINVTFHANSATDQGGGIYNDNGSHPSLQNITISGNTASQGGGIYNAYGSDPTIINSILYNDSGGEIFDVSGTRIVNYSIVQGGYPGTSNLDADPLLSPLQNNGGYVQTMALLSGSTAIDAGDDSNCPATDQRGFYRPQGSHCDIGSFEYFAFVPATPCPTIPATGTSTPTPTATQTFAPTAMATPSQTPTSSATPTPPTTSVVSYDRDTTGVFRPSNGALYLKNQNMIGYADIQINYGVGGDYPIVGDWDGNGTVTIGIYRNGSFYLRNENTIGFADVMFAFGAPGDQPVSGDWNGDGVDTIGVYRNSTFFLRNENSAGAPSATFALGIPGDVGIAGDWNGDGLDTTGVFRPSNGALYLKNQNTTGYADIQINYGIAGDKPVTGDWNNDGVDTIGVYRNGMFMLRNSNTIGFADIVFGLGIPGDMPIAGNWDGLP